MANQNILSPTQFKQNQLIHSIHKKPNWTVSTDIDSKKPLDFGYYETHHELRNYSPKQGTKLVTLDEIDADPNFYYTNRTYRLDCFHDLIMCLDIEPIASQSIINTLLQLPISYGERSTHNGYHLLLKVPESLDLPQYADLFGEVNLKGPNRSDLPADDPNNKPQFEIIFNKHFVTLTKKAVINQNIDNTDPLVINKIKTFLDQMLASYNQQQQAKNEHQIEIDAIDLSHYPDAQILAENFPQNQINRIMRFQPQQANNDLSKWEFQITSKFIYQMYYQMELKFNDPFFDTVTSQPLAELPENTVIMAVYQLLQDHLPARPKHAEQRDGLPWLLYTVTKAIQQMNYKQAAHENFIHDQPQRI